VDAYPDWDPDQVMDSFEGPDDVVTSPGSARSKNSGSLDNDNNNMK